MPTPRSGSRLRLGGSAAFTLLELVVVLAVFAVLAAVSVPVFQTVKRNAATRTAQSNAEAVARNADAIRLSDGTGFAAALTTSLDEHTATASHPFTTPTENGDGSRTATTTISGFAVSCTWSLDGARTSVDCGEAPDPTPPSAPLALTATPKRSSVTLSWNTPSDGGSPITSYLVEYSDGSGFVTFADDVTGTSSTVTGLTNNTAYVFRVSAVNAFGTGASATATATPALEWEFVTATGNTANDHAYTSAETASGGLLVAGQFRYDVTFGSTTLTPFGCPTSGNCADIFVAELDASGTWLWAQRAGGFLTEAARGIAPAPDGGAYVVGEFYANTNGMHFPTAAGGNITIHNGGSLDLFVAKIGSDGFWQWAKRAGTTGVDTAYDAVAVTGGVVFAGRFSGSNVAFGSSITRSSSGGSSDVLVARMSDSGDWVWVATAGGASVDDYASGLDVLGDGDVVAVGQFAGTATFGSATLTSNGLTDLFAARIDGSTGSWEWAVSAGSSSLANGDTATRVSASTGSGIYVSGTVGGTTVFGATTLTTAGGTDAFVANIDADGTWVWATSFGGTGADGAYSVSANGDGVIVAGVFSGTGTFGTTTLTSAGGFDVFVGEISSTGTWSWVTRAGGAGADYGYDTAALFDGGVLVTGWFESSASFGSFTPVSAGVADAFIGKIAP